ncbi:MAG: MotA/TolQ/ExbB proton channel family protein [Pirellulales bacterium]
MNLLTLPLAVEAPHTFWQIVFSGGPVGITIMILLILVSVAAVALMVEHAISIRAAVLLPAGLSEKVRRSLLAGQVDPARDECRKQPSFLAYVLEAGLSEVDGGWAAIEKAVEDALAEHAARLFRKVEYLAVISNVGPMLGLLGTVTGLIMAFMQVAATEGAARPAELAEGIYSALVTTVAGLMIAIPSVGALAVFRNRIDELVAEAAYAAQHALAPLKRLRRAPAPPPVSEATP